MFSEMLAMGATGGGSSWGIVTPKTTSDNLTTPIGTIIASSGYSSSPARAFNRTSGTGSYCVMVNTSGSYIGFHFDNPTIIKFATLQAADGGISISVDYSDDGSQWTPMKTGMANALIDLENTDKHTWYRIRQTAAYGGSADCWWQEIYFIGSPEA